VGIDEKPTAAWNEQDLQELCDDRRREGPRLEYKQQVDISTGAGKDRIEHSIQALANAGGGHLVIGIKEYEVDGAKFAGELIPIADGAFPDDLNNVLDGRGDPKVPFELHVIEAAAGGTYVVIEVHGRRAPHMANNGRYYVRRNLLARQMTEAEVADSYRRRFERERKALEPEPTPDSGADQAESRVRSGLTGPELATYERETRDAQPPGWLAVWSHPVPLQHGLVDPRQHDAFEFLNMPVEGLWREHPMRYFNLRKTTSGFTAQLPPDEDAYPTYFTRVWSDGLLEWGDLQTTMVRQERPEDNRLIATHAVAEYVHDFLMFAKAAYEHLGWHGTVQARARLTHVSGYRLAVDRNRYLRGDLVLRDAEVSSDPWDGPVESMSAAAVEVAHEISDRIFIAGGVEGGSYLFDRRGNWLGRG
jgi:hypothetical protein